MGPTMGLIVNPIAGMGGPVALRGTDGDRARRARELGAAPVAGLRADRALRQLARSLPRLKVLAAAGSMGADLSRAYGWTTVDVAVTTEADTSAEDTRSAAGRMAEQHVDLLLFAGGDGTARDVLEGTGTAVPVLGVPTGVKMHSGVFATSPEAAGDVAARFLQGGREGSVREVEVLDADRDGGWEAGAGAGMTPRLFGVARVPHAPGRLQGPKAVRPTHDEAALDALCHEVAGEMEPGRLYIVGPGTTTARILAALDLTGTLTGVDAVRDGALVGSDLSERNLLDLVTDGPPATIILGVIGGQGFLLGRGNQQISPAVLDRVGAENVVVVASAEKVLALDPPVLRVDLGDERPDAGLAGYRRVRTGPGRVTVLRVVV